MINFDFLYATDIGLKRERNEDITFAKTNKYGDTILLALDGMGGHRKGDLASKKAFEYIKEEFDRRKSSFTYKFSMIKWVKDIIKNTNKILHNFAYSALENEKMGTTIVLVLISKGRTIVSSVGDSRCYIIVNDKLKQVTEDDSFVYEEYKKGRISKEEMKTHARKNQLTKALGPYSKLKITVKTIKDKYSQILLCTDGLYMKMEDEEIKGILNKKIDINLKVRELIKLALSRGGEDNIGLVIYEVK